MSKLKVLDLFSGIGGFSLGLERTGGFETVAFCEIEPFCQKVLKKHWPDVPIYEDVRTLEYDGPVDLICGGYPCQPFSVAGKREGAEDDRHLWPAMFELVKKHRPTWVIGENVAGHISMGLDEVLTDLESENYGARAFVIPACAIDAPHRRDRIWIVSHSKKLFSNGGGEHWEQGQRQISQSGKRSSAAILPDPFGKRGCSGNTEWENASNAWQSSSGQGNDTRGMATWLPEPNVGRVANGVPDRAHRLKSLGNAVVPQVVQRIGEAILHAEQV